MGIIDYNNLEKSISNIISTQYFEFEKPDKCKLFIHMPPKRFHPTFVLYFSLIPENTIFFISNDLYDDFKKSFEEYIEWIKEKYINSIHVKLRKVLINNLVNFGKNVQYINLLEKFENIDEFYEYTYKFILKRIKDIQSKNFSPIDGSKVIIDITGGKKIHSIMLYEISQALNVSYSYLSVNEVIYNKYNDNNILKSESGTEMLIIKNKEKGEFNYYKFEDTLNISISKKQIRVFYNENYYEHIPDFESVNFINIKNKMNILNKMIPQHTVSGLEKMLTPLFIQIKNELKKFLSENFYKIIENYKGKIVKLIFDKQTFDIPVEFLFDKDRYFIVKKIVSPLNLIGTKINIVKSDKIKMLIIYNKHDLEEVFFKKSVEIFNELEMYFKNVVEFNFLEIEKVDDFKYSLNSYWDIIHYIGHTDYDENGMFLVINKGGSIYDKVYFNEKIIDFKAKMIFFNSCNSASEEIEYDKSFLKTYIDKNCDLFIGTRWNIRTEDVFLFNKKFYKNLFSFKTVGESFYNSINEFDSIFLKYNYSFYGNPYYKFAIL